MDGPSSTCTYLGPEQDPRKGPVHYCGQPSVQGKSYCVHHYPVVYMVGTSVNRKRAHAKALDQELAKLAAEQAEEMENEYLG